MFPYIPITKQDEDFMLNTIGIKTIDELFLDIPENLRFNRDLNINSFYSEVETRKIIENLANKNVSSNEALCFLGKGTYDSYIPSVVPYLSSRSEFSTAYTPYQPEISQGTLRAIFEYQSLICNLTDMYASNASMYDGATAAAEAVLMAFDAKKGNTIYISETVNEEVVEVVKTYLKFRNYNIVMISEEDYITDYNYFKNIIDSDGVGFLMQSPNKYGLLEDYTSFIDETKGFKGLNIMYVDPSSLGIFKTPGEYDVDIAIGDLQSFGNEMNFGGPHIGFMATTKKLMRKLPGRIVGQAQDSKGERAFVLTLQAREQHIRREKATSNICSNQALNALRSTIYMSTLGKEGISEIAINSTNKAHYVYENLLKLENFTKVTDNVFYREFLLKTKISVDDLNQYLSKNGVLELLKIEDNIISIAVTEKRTKDELDFLINVLAELVGGNLNE